MMRAETTVNVHMWPTTMKSDVIENDRQNDSGISPGRTSSEATSNSPGSENNFPTSTSTPKQQDKLFTTNELAYHTPNTKFTTNQQPYYYNHENAGIYPRPLSDLTYTNYPPFPGQFPNYYPNKINYGYGPMLRTKCPEEPDERSEEVSSPKRQSNCSEKLVVDSPVSSPNSISNSSKSQNGTEQEKCDSSKYDNPEDSLERLKMALQNSTALSGIFKSSSHSEDDDDNSQENDRKEFSCPLCAYTTPYRHRYIEHVNTHYSDKCTLCDFKGQDLRIHLQEIHNIRDVNELGGESQDMSDGDEDDNNPNNKRNKSKSFKCKQCNYVTTTKLDFWEHSKEHIKQEKLLTCPKCPFVTEYKHHLEYHLRNHFGSKPFKCPKCSYTCVNKSMLNSHLKSHSNIYQYRCADCAYATKYCHSLKLHLRKYQHKPSVVLNSDGSPNPLPIIDVYGTRRGPKQKNNKDDKTGLSIKIPNKTQSSPYSSPKSFYDTTENSKDNKDEAADNNNKVESTDECLPTKMFYCNVCEFCSSSQDMLGHHMFLHAAETNFAKFLQTNNNTTTEPGLMKDYINNMFVPREEQHSPALSSQGSLVSPRIHSPILKQPISPLDLSKPETEPDEVENKRKYEEDKSDKQDTRQTKHRRKGKAYKLERINENAEENEVEEAETFQIKVPEYKIKNPPITKEKNMAAASDANSNDTYVCSYCDISFKDIVMYTMHMGYHGYQDPFTCNMCGHVTQDKVAFFLHIARSSHC